MSSPRPDEFHESSGDRDPGTQTEYLNSVYVFVDAVDDSTIRPTGFEIPREWPRPEFPKKQPPNSRKPEDPKES
jgi:hypothetical protein